MTKKAKIRVAVFPVAGLGTRFLPATKSTPKEMLTLVDKPLIQYTVEEARNSGLKDVVFVTSAGKASIIEHFEASPELEKHLNSKGEQELLRIIKDVSNLVEHTSTPQPKPLGLGHAVLCARAAVGDEAFAVLLGDDIIDSRVPALKQMIRAFENLNGKASIIAVQRVPKKEAHLYGVVNAKKVEDRLYRITDLKEKPKNPESNLAVIGRYILTPRIFTELKKTKKGRGGEIQLTDAIKGLLKHEEVYAYEFEGDRYDAGDKAGFIKANIALALKRPELKREIRKFIKSIV